jgi:hypothetical protein
VPWLVAWLLVPRLFAPGFFMAGLGMHRLGMLRFALALRLELMDAALRLDHGRIDVRGHLLAVAAGLTAVPIAATTAAASTALLVATTLRAVAALGARIAGIRAGQLLLWRLNERRSFAFGLHRLRLVRLRLRLVRGTLLLPLLMLRALSLLLTAVVGPRATVRPAIVALSVALSISLSIAMTAVA